jgi:hypothetical protein
MGTNLTPERFSFSEGLYSMWKQQPDQTKGDAKLSNEKPNICGQIFEHTLIHLKNIPGQFEQDLPSLSNAAKLKDEVSQALSEGTTHLSEKVGGVVSWFFGSGQIESSPKTINPLYTSESNEPPKPPANPDKDINPLYTSELNVEEPKPQVKEQATAPPLKASDQENLKTKEREKKTDIDTKKRGVTPQDKLVVEKGIKRAQERAKKGKSVQPLQQRADRKHGMTLKTSEPSSEKVAKPILKKTGAEKVTGKKKKVSFNSKVSTKKGEKISNENLNDSNPPKI